MTADPLAPANTLQSWMNSVVQGCWACDAIDNLSDLGLSIADQTYTALAGNVATLIGLVMAIWILLFAGRMFLPFGPDGNPGSLWNQGAKKLFHFALVLAFLQSSQAFWDYVFTPLLSTGLGIASSIMTIGDTSSTCADGGTGASTGTGLAGAQSVMKQINCPMAGIQSQFAEGIAIGTAVIAAPTSCPQNSFSLTGIAIGFADSLFAPIQIAINIICGLTIVVIYFFDYLMFPILLIDVILRSTVIAVISPIAIAASLFHPTRHVAQKAAWGLVQSGVTLIFAAVVGAIGKSTIAAIFSGLATAPGVTITDWASLSSALSDPCTSGLSFGLTSLAFYKVVGLGIILIFMMRKASSMAAEFTGSAAGDFSGARAGAATIAGKAGYAVGTAIDMAGGKIGGSSGSRGKLAASVSGTEESGQE